MNNITKALAEHQLEQVKRDFKLYKSLIEVQKDNIRCFRGTEAAVMSLKIIATLIDMIEDLVKEAKECKKEISQHAEIEPRNKSIKNITIGCGKTYERGKM